jgi:tRNA (Thr-GGU) A37 N-methylase
VKGPGRVRAVTFTPIGYVENDFHAPTTPETIAAAESRIVVAPEFVKGLTGLEAGQRVMIVFHFHLAAPSGACSPCTRPIVPILLG